MKKSLLLLFLSISFISQGITHFVTNVADTGVGSLRHAVSLAEDFDTVRFSQNLLLNGSDTINFFSPMAIEKGITIKGLMNATDTIYLNGQGITRLLVFNLYYTEHQSALVDSLVFINGGSSFGAGGGGIRVANYDEIIISNSVFRDCQGSSGAAIYTGETSPGILGDVFITNCNIYNNIAESYGGAISTAGPNVIVDNCHIYNNICGEDGGAIYSNSHHRVTIKNSNIHDNSAQENGGGYFGYYFDTLFVENTTFHHNKANYGGSIFAPEHSEFLETNFHNDTATQYGGSLVIQSFAVSSIFDNCDIYNSHSSRGGAMYCSGDIRMNNCNVYNNSSTGYAGGIYFNSRLQVDRSSFFDNHANNTGGALYGATYSKLFIDKSTVNKNKAQHGAGIYMYRTYTDSSITVTNTTISNNDALFAGGIGFGYHSQSIKLNIESSVVAGNYGWWQIELHSIQDTINSLGYNFIGDTLVNGALPTDHIGVSTGQVNIRPLGYRGGNTKTAPPGYGSIVINSGKPTDFSTSQNIAIEGVRDAGSAEFQPYYNDTVYTCDEHYFNDSIYTVSGFYIDTVHIGNVIDTLATLNLNINYSTHYTDHVVACESHTWINGATYYYDTDTTTHIILNAAGCDSIITLNLSIQNTTNTFDSITACEEYTWINGETYTSNNFDAFDTIASVIGCDSVVHLALTILNATNYTDVIMACDSLTWINGITYSSDNSSASDTLINAQGCDSIVYLDLTIIEDISSTDVIEACDTYTWIDGITYTSNNSSAFDTLSNALGCDSIVYLDLTINQVDTTVSVNSITITANQSNASYRWLDCENNFALIDNETEQNFTPDVNGEYAVEITLNGCTDTSRCIIIETVSILENALFSKIALSPNPSNGTFTFQFNELKNLHISIHNIAGELVFEKDNISQNEFTMTLDEAPGMYFVQIRNIDHRVEMKLIID